MAAYNNVHLKFKQDIKINLPRIGFLASMSSFMFLKSFLAGKKLSTSYYIALKCHFSSVVFISKG